MFAYMLVNFESSKLKFRNKRLKQKTKEKRMKETLDLIASLKLKIKENLLFFRLNSFKIWMNERTNSFDFIFFLVVVVVGVTEESLVSSSFFFFLIKKQNKFLRLIHVGI